MAYDPYAYNPQDYDYQDQWNNAAADQNAALRQQQLVANPTPDPRALVAQQLSQKYGAQAPSFSNVLGHYSVNDQPIDTMASFLGMPMGDTGEAGAQLQFAMAKRKAAQDFVDRASGNVPAGTAGRQLLQDPNFLHMTDADKAATYGQVYQHPLLEDLQADQYGKLGMPTPMLSDVRFRNTMPDRQKAASENLKTQEQIYGAHPGVLVGDLVKDEHGVPVSGYDESSQTAYAPGGFGQDPATGAYIQKPAIHVFMPNFNRNSIRQNIAVAGGLQSYPQAPRANMDQVVNGPLNALTTGFNNKLQQWGQPPLLSRSPALDQKIADAQTQSDAVLKNKYGIALNPGELKQAIHLAVSFAGGNEFNESHLLSAARMIQDEGVAHAQQLDTARQTWQDRNATQFQDFGGP